MFGLQSNGQATGSSGQVGNGFMIITILIMFILTTEYIYKMGVESRRRFVTLLDYTANADDMSISIHQDASKYTDAKEIGLSINERTGIEFAYSFYIYINPATFSNRAVFKHVFHKGYASPWPLMAPGVFIHGDSNTMRVVMNTYKNPYTYADVKNIPVEKWVHVVLNNYKGGLDIFINGNLSNRISFKDTLPYQNFQDIVIFSNTNNNTLTTSSIAVLDSNFELEGSFKGLLSNLTYARYALSMNEIQRLMAAGPSTKVKQKNLDKPPYLGDDWWMNSS
jgi:Concanavalin A-like lectin/glucanases superfamily